MLDAGSQCDEMASQQSLIGLQENHGKKAAKSW